MLDYPTEPWSMVEQNNVFFLPVSAVSEEMEMGPWVMILFSKAALQIQSPSPFQPSHRQDTLAAAGVYSPYSKVTIVVKSFDATSDAAWPSVFVRANSLLGPGPNSLACTGTTYRFKTGRVGDFASTWQQQSSDGPPLQTINTKIPDSALFMAPYSAVNSFQLPTVTQLTTVAAYVRTAAW